MAATKAYNRRWTQINAARPAATKERFKPDLPKRLAALREKGSLKISFRFEKNLTVSSADNNRTLINSRRHNRNQKHKLTAETQRNAEEHWDADSRGSNLVLLPPHGLPPADVISARSAGPCGGSKSSADPNAFVDPRESA
jgi:hypothetical protein